MNPVAVLLMLVLLGSCQAGTAKPLEGYWKRKLTCASYSKEPDLCGKGPRFYGTPDYFELGVVVKGHLVCGIVISSANLNHKTDTSYFVGSVEGNLAKIVYGSSHAEKSLRGHATVQARGSRVDWRVVEPLGMGYMWDSALASTSSWPTGLKERVSAWCNARWNQIKERGGKDVDLQFD